jgi:hypothetical protein
MVNAKAVGPAAPSAMRAKSANAALGALFADETLERSQGDALLRLRRYQNN